MDKPTKKTKKSELAAQYQGSKEGAAEAKRAADKAQQEEEAREALHQEDRQRTVHRLRVWLHNGSLSVEGVSSFFLRGWDIGASEGRLRLVEPAALLRVTFTCPEAVSFLVLRLHHLSAGEAPSLITITINKQAAFTEINPPKNYYARERFDLSSYVKAGENSLEIMLGKATSPYWLESLELLY